MNIFPKRWRRMPLVVIAIVASTGVGIAVANGATSTLDLEPSTAAAGGPVSSIPSELESSFAVLRRPRQSSDTIPSTAGSEQENGGIASHYGVNESLSRLVGSADGMSVWLVPGSAGSCIVLSSGGGACGSNEILLTKGLMVGLVPVSGESTTVVGVVPDGTSVTATNGKGTRRSIPIVGNTYGLSGADTASFTVNAPGGSPTTEHLPTAASAPTQQPTPSSNETESPPSAG